jgi:ribonuclease VapC
MSAVLDASALLALLNEETGSDVVEAHLPGALISAVNMAEVVSKLCEGGMPATEVHEIVLDLGITISPFTAEEAMLAGFFRPLTRDAGLSLGDRCCLALAHQSGALCLTADRSWSKLEAVGVNVRQIR